MRPGYKFIYHKANQPILTLISFARTILQYNLQMNILYHTTVKTSIFELIFSSEAVQGN